MNRRRFLRRSLALLTAGPALPRCVAAVASSDRPVLTNGVDLAGWHQLANPKNEKYRGARWFVDQRAICGEQHPDGDRRGGMLLSDATYGDFDLTVDIRPDWGCDSGLILRTNPDGTGLQVLIDYLPGGAVGFLHGQGIGYYSCPIELRANAGGQGVHAVDTYDAVRRDGLVYAASAAQWNDAWCPHDWNTLRVCLAGRDPNMTTWINGTKIAEMNAAGFRPRHVSDVRARNWDAPSAFDRENIFAMLGRRGHVALQVHPGDRWSENGLTRFRNFRMKLLPPI